MSQFAAIRIVWSWVCELGSTIMYIEIYIVIIYLVLSYMFCHQHLSMRAWRLAGKLRGQKGTKTSTVSYTRWSSSLVKRFFFRQLICAIWLREIPLERIPLRSLCWWMIFIAAYKFSEYNRVIVDFKMWDRGLYDLFFRFFERGKQNFSQNSLISCKITCSIVKFGIMKYV